MPNYMVAIANSCVTVRGLRSHKFAMHGLVMEKPAQPLEGAMIKAAVERRPGMSIRKLADLVDLSEARVRQYINGYTSAGRGQYVTVEAPADRLAAISHVLHISPEELDLAGRSDAATLQRERESTSTSVGAAEQHEPEFEFLTRVREDLTAEEMDQLMTEATPYLEMLVRDIKNRQRGEG